MKGQVIGAKMGNGYAGSYSRQPDSIINTLPASGDIAFGEATVRHDGKIMSIPTYHLTSSSALFAAVLFEGVAVREVKSATNYLSQNAGSYTTGDAVPVIERGSVNVICQKGTPAQGGDVYVRKEANSSYPTCKVGGFEAAADSTKTEKLTNAQWGGAADSNGVAELVILQRINA